MRSSLLEDVTRTLVQEVFVTCEYDKKGNENLIACSYPNIAKDLKPGSQILCADGSLVLTVIEAQPEKKGCLCRCVNTVTIGCAHVSVMVALHLVFLVCSLTHLIAYTAPHVHCHNSKVSLSVLHSTVSGVWCEPVH